MTKMSGLVAILSDDGLSIAEIRDLGPELVDVKPGRAVPLIDVHPQLKSGEKEGENIITLAGDHAERTWSVVSLYSGEDVDAERERRIALPLTVQIPSTGEVFQINMDEKAQRNVAGLATSGIFFKSAAPSTTRQFRDYANKDHTITPDDMIAIGLQAAGRIEAIYQKSWAIKAITPIPADYADDSRW